MNKNHHPSLWVSLMLSFLLALAGFIATYISTATILVILFFVLTGGFLFIFTGDKSFRFNILYLGLPTLGFILGSVLYYTAYLETSVPSLETLANSGDSKAQYTLGLLGIVANDKESVKHLVNAAESGNPDAQFVVGLLLQRSSYEHASSDAYKWLLLSSRNGNKDAIEAIEKMALTPEERARGEALALEWQNSQ